jgi:type II secretory pathway component GspD/PulD (secretin)
MASPRLTSIATSVLALAVLLPSADLHGQEGPQQVLLEVKFAEASRVLSRDLGVRLGLGGGVNGFPVLERNARFVATVGKTFTDTDDQSVLNLNAGFQLDLVANSLRSNVGTSLLTVPRITPYGTIEIEFESVSYSIPNLQIDRQIETGVVVGGGTRIVVGGLDRGSAGSARAKLPILADIAILGRLFENSRKAQVRAGLIIFISPVIIDAE